MKILRKKIKLIEICLVGHRAFCIFSNLFEPANS